jgi:hypothetical protein
MKHLASMELAINFPMGISKTKFIWLLGTATFGLPRKEREEFIEEGIGGFWQKIDKKYYSLWKGGLEK